MKLHKLLDYLFNHIFQFVQFTFNKYLFQLFFGKKKLAIEITDFQQVQR